MRYLSYSEYLKKKYGEKVYKIPVNLDITCPNRDGNCGEGGCIFCGAEGAAFENLPPSLPVKEQIEKNYDSYIARLDSLSEDIAAASEQVKDVPVMTFHDAYSYLARDMGFHIVDTVESGEGGEPSARELAHLADEITEHSVKALFIEPDYSGSAAEILSRETGVSVYTLNPVTKGDAVLTAYEDIMRNNIKIIVEAVK